MQDSYTAPRPRGEWDCVGCGVYVGVKANPLDASDPRPLCYDCAVRERDGREHRRRTLDAAARGVPAALRELADMDAGEREQMIAQWLRERQAQERTTQDDTARRVVGLICDGWAPEQVMRLYHLRERERRERGEHGGAQ